jgi:hypothetical protein
MNNILNNYFEEGKDFKSIKGALGLLKEIGLISEEEYKIKFGEIEREYYDFFVRKVTSAPELDILELIKERPISETYLETFAILQYVLNKVNKEEK